MQNIIFGPNQTGFFDMFRFGGGASPPSVFVVSEPITAKFCTVLDHQGVSLNMKKFCIINDVTVLKLLLVVQKYKKTKNRKNTINSLINGHIMLKFCTGVAHDKTIPHSK